MRFPFPSFPPSGRGSCAASKNLYKKFPPQISSDRHRLPSALTSCIWGALRPLHPLLPAILQHFWAGRGRGWKRGKRTCAPSGSDLTCWRGKLVSGRRPPQSTPGARAAPGRSEKALRGLPICPSEASHKPDFSSPELLKGALMVLGPFPFPRAGDSARSSCDWGGDPGQRLTRRSAPSMGWEAPHPSRIHSPQAPRPHLAPLSPPLFFGSSFPSSLKKLF